MITNISQACMMSDTDTTKPKSIWYLKVTTIKVEAKVCDGKNKWIVDLPLDIEEEELLLNLREQFL